MSKSVLVICTSMRRNSNSEILADAFIAGAQAAGNTVEKLTLRDKTISFCRGCMACMKLQRCVMQDDAGEIVRKMHDADVIAFATPIYYFEMSGQMKTLLDRSTPLYTSDYKFRDIYMLTAAAEAEAETPQIAECGLQGWIKCFKHARLAGTVFAGSVNEPGDVKTHPAMDQAREMGAAIG